MTWSAAELAARAAGDELVDAELASAGARIFAGMQVPADVAAALGEARAAGVRSVWCRGLWRFETGATWAWRPMDAPGSPSVLNPSRFSPEGTP